MVSGETKEPKDRKAIPTTQSGRDNPVRRTPPKNPSRRVRSGLFQVGSWKQFWREAGPLLALPSLRQRLRRTHSENDVHISDGYCLVPTQAVPAVDACNREKTCQQRASHTGCLCWQTLPRSRSGHCAQASGNEHTITGPYAILSCSYNLGASYRDFSGEGRSQCIAEFGPQD
jgi:hypothetical protein